MSTVIDLHGRSESAPRKKKEQKTERKAMKEMWSVFFHRATGEQRQQGTGSNSMLGR